MSGAKEPRERMTTVNGNIVAVYGNLVVAQVRDRVVQNSIGHCIRTDGTRLLSEVVRVRGQLADLQVFEETRGLHVGDEVEFQPHMLSVALGPGLLGQVYDARDRPGMAVGQYRKALRLLERKEAGL